MLERWCKDGRREGRYLGANRWFVRYRGLGQWWGRVRNRFSLSLSLSLRLTFGELVRAKCACFFRRRRRGWLDTMRACMWIERVLPGIKDLMAVSAAREPTGACKHGILHAENRFAVGTAGG